MYKHFIHYYSLGQLVKQVAFFAYQHPGFYRDFISVHIFLIGRNGKSVSSIERNEFGGLT